MDEVELFAAAVDLFEGRALIWYRAIRAEVNSWQELVSKIREQFQPTDYNQKLLEEIKKRTQGNDETIGIYLSVMRALFGRMTCAVEEGSQLKIILRNLTPFYQTQLGLIEIKNIEHLRELGKRLEARREAVEAFTAPSKKNSTLEPDLAYVSTAASVNTTNVSTISSKGESQKPFLCFNCNKPGHKAIACLEKKKKYCYRCKTEGFTVRSCPKCNNRSGNGSNRS